MSRTGKMDRPDKDGPTPTLRFPEFDDGCTWQRETLCRLASPVKDKATGGDNEDTLTLSGEVGLVPQGDYFGKQISGENVSRYIKIVRDDFVYNDRTTKASKFGSIKRLTSADGGIVSPIYKCFRFKSGQNPVFWDYYFESQAHEAQLGDLVNEGARAGRFNISIDKFLSIDVWKPASPEQERIAECLASIDALIQAETEKLEALKDHKQGLMFELFPIKGETLPKRRFTDFQDPEGWVEKPLGKIADYENGKAYEKNIEEAGDFVVVNARFISTDGEVRKYSNERFCIASKGDVLMVLSDLPKGRALAKCFLVDENEKYAVNQRVSRLTAHSIESTFLYYALDRHPFLLAFNDGLNQTHLSKGSVLECPIAFPLDENEQAKIVAILKAVDEQIRSQAQKVEQLKDHKQGLLQQLFPILDEVNE